MKKIRYFLLILLLWLANRLVWVHLYSTSYHSREQASWWSSGFKFWRNWRGIWDSIYSL